MCYETNLSIADVIMEKIVYYLKVDNLVGQTCYSPVLCNKFSVKIIRQFSFTSGISGISF
jgi:hypothetical protein